MFVSHLKVRNWRNFPLIDVDLQSRQFVVGPNASGKSNLMDVFRFLRDITKIEGGGLQKAVADRGGMTKIRNLAARRDPDIAIEVRFSEPDERARNLALRTRTQAAGPREQAYADHVRKSEQERGRHSRQAERGRSRRHCAVDADLPGTDHRQQGIPGYSPVLSDDHLSPPGAAPPPPYRSDSRSDPRRRSLRAGFPGKRSPGSTNVHDGPGCPGSSKC